MPLVGRISSWKSIVVSDEQAVAHAHEHEVLLGAQDDAAERRAVGARHDLDQQAVGALDALGLAGWAASTYGWSKWIGSTSSRSTNASMSIVRVLRGCAERELLVGEHDLLAVVGS